MKFESLDDYYLWTCDWCDSENRTLWVKVAQGEVACGACHLSASHPTSGRGTEHRGSRIMAGLC